MMPPAPPVDTRTAAAIADRLRTLLTEARVWRAKELATKDQALGRRLMDDATVRNVVVAKAGTVVDAVLLSRLNGNSVQVATDDPSHALVAVAARFAEIVIQRLNQTPDKAFLAFLDMIGIEPQPAEAARVLLTFQPVPGAPAGILVPKGIRVAAQPKDGDSGPVVFETERNFHLSDARLAFLHAIGVDGSCQVWPVLESGWLGESKAVPTTPRLWVSHPVLAALPAEVKLRIAGQDIKATVAPTPPAAVAWRSTGPWAHHDLVQESGIPPKVAVVVNAISRDIPTPAAFCNGEAVDASKDFMPFGPHPKLGDAFYVACGPRLKPPGGTLAQKTTLHVHVRTAGTGNVVLIWEYSTDTGWMALGTSGFQDTTMDFTEAGACSSGTLPESKNITVTWPDKWAETVVNGVPGHWLRVWIAAGGYGQPGRFDSAVGYIPDTFKPPVLARLTLTTSYDEETFSPVAALLETHLAVADKTEVDAVNREAQAAALYFGFQPARRDATLGDTPLSLYCRLADNDPGHGKAVWEYRGRKDWVRLVCDDETGGLARSGLMRFTPPADFQPAERFGERRFWLRARAPAGKLPKLSGVFLNACWASHAIPVASECPDPEAGGEGLRFRVARVPVLNGESVEVQKADGTWERWFPVGNFNASGPDSRDYTLDRATGRLAFGNGRFGRKPDSAAGFRITYRAGGGAIGNRPADTITQLMSPLPYVAAVTNPLPAAGGRDAENLASVRRRGPLTLRHGDRAVTATDYEDIARAASSRVVRAKVAPATGDGTVVVRVLASGEVGQPLSQELRTKIWDRLTKACPPTVKVKVSGPDWVPANVQVTLTVPVADMDEEIGRQVQERLNGFLNPVTGGPRQTGWDFGESPSVPEMRLLLLSINRRMGVKISWGWKMTLFGIITPGKITIKYEQQAEKGGQV